MTEDHHKAWRRYRRRKRAVWLFADLPLALLMAFVLCVVLGVVVLKARVVTVPDRFTSLLNEQVAGSVDGYDVTFGHLDIGLGKRFHPRIVLRDVAVARDTGAPLVDLGLIDLTLDLPSLLTGEARPSAVAFSGGLISLTRDTDGAFDLGFESTETQVQAASLPEAIAAIEAVFDHPNLTKLEDLHIDGLTVRYEDKGLRETLTFDGGRFVAGRDPASNDLRLRTDLALLTGRGDPATFAISYRKTGTGDGTVTADLDGILAADIADQSPALAWLSLIDAPISGSLRTQVSEEGDSPLFATLNFGSGTILPDDTAQRIGFSEAKTYFTYHPSRDRLDIDTLNIQSDWGRFEGEGYALIDAQGFVISATTDALLVAAQGPLAEQLPISSAAIDLRLALDPVKITVGQAFAQLGNSTLRFDGAIAKGPQGWDQAVNLHVDDIAVADFMPHWPETVRPGFRAWFEKNITTGRVQNLTAGLRKAQSSANQSYATFEFRDADVGFMKDMPAITGAGGQGSIIGNRMDLKLDRGTVEFNTAGRVDVSGSTMHIPQMSMKPALARFDLVMDGPLSAVLTALDRKPMNILSKAGRGVDLASGWATTDLALAVPLRKGLKPKDIIYQADATLRQIKSTNLVPGQTVKAERLAVTATNTGVTISGKAQLGAVPADLVWRQRRGVAGSTIEADIVVSDAGLKQFNIALPPGTVSGRTAAKLNVNLPKGQAPEFKVTSRLSGLGISVPALNWSKSKNSRGAFSIAGRLSKTPEISAISLEAPGLKASGSLKVSNGRLSEARFDDVAVGTWLRGGVRFADRGKGRPMAIDLRNARLDLRGAPLSGGSGNAPPIKGVFRRLIISDTLAITDAQLDLSGGSTLSGQFFGKINGGTNVRGRLRRENGTTVIDITSNNAGRALRDAGLLKQADGGSLDLQLRSQKGGGWRGKATVKDARITDAPVVAELLSAVSVIGILEQLDGRGLMMGEVLADFSLKGDQFTLYSASAVGPSLGMSLDGYINTRTKQMDLQGVLSPFYLVNAIGAIFTRRGEGLIGFNFTLKGTPNDTSVGVNPLSLLTPGLFREIFRRPPPKVVE